MRSIRRTLLAASLATALVALPTAASAGERPDHAGRDDSGSSQWTEDNDTNDGGTGNNVADDGDNAHPSGKDRSVEHGRSGNQGKAKSDPDDDGRGPDRTNGGPDKANGAGGVDKVDQDGNNGCGNDDDFEDDNEGWCGGKRKTNSGPKTDDRGPKTDDRGPKTDDRGPKTDDRGPKTGDRGNDGSTGSQGGTADTSVSATCPATSVSVSSTKDLSNVVLVFADGDHQKFGELSGKSATLAGTGSNAGERITRVYVKSGANSSGEGPGYGERHDIDCAGVNPGDQTGDDCPAGETMVDGECLEAGSDGDTGNVDVCPTDASMDADDEDCKKARVNPRTTNQPSQPDTDLGAGDDDSDGPNGVPGGVQEGVLGVVIDRPAAPAAGSPGPGAVEAAGLGVTAAPGLVTAPADAGSLARTGVNAIPAMALAVMALLAGSVAVRRNQTA